MLDGQSGPAEALGLAPHAVVGVGASVAPALRLVAAVALDGVAGAAGAGRLHHTHAVEQTLLLALVCRGREEDCSTLPYFYFSLPSVFFFLSVFLCRPSVSALIRLSAGERLRLSASEQRDRVMAGEEEETTEQLSRRGTQKYIYLYFKLAKRRIDCSSCWTICEVRDKKKKIKKIFFFFDH